MARISSYPYKPVVTDNDAWIGTNAGNRSTKQFTASAVANYLNLSSKVSVGGQMIFTWSDTQNGGTGTVSKTGGGGSGTAFNTLTELRLEFSSKELAVSYAQKNKINFELIEQKKRKTVKKSYADNFLR